MSRTFKDTATRYTESCRATHHRNYYERVTETAKLLARAYPDAGPDELESMAIDIIRGQ